MTASRRRGWLPLLLFVGAAQPAAGSAGPVGATAGALADFERRVTVRTLANGLTALVCERGEGAAPVFSFHTLVDVGSDREVPGQTGLAHLFEHMAFKGTERIGTRDAAGERRALEAVERAYAALREARRAGRGVAAAEATFQAAAAAADRFVERGEFNQILEREGAVDVNAGTTADETSYSYSLPASRLALWAHLEAQRFLNPVLREFYKERDVVMEERRMRTESNPLGRLLEELLAVAFAAHPYGQPISGWAADLQALSATDARRFFQTYYVPASMTVAVVGGVRAAEALPLIERAFGPLPARPRPEPLRSQEPPQRGERQVVLREDAHPLYAEAYHRPDERHPDDAVYAVLEDLLASGRTARLYRALVRDSGLAAEASALSGLPGTKYPGLFLVYAVPARGRTPAQVRAVLRRELWRLTQEPVGQAELLAVRRRAQAELWRSLQSDAGLAEALARYQARFGDWRELFRQAERLGAVTAADLMRVARATFREENRTVGMIETRARRPDRAGAAP